MRTVFPIQPDPEGSVPLLKFFLMTETSLIWHSGTSESFLSRQGTQSTLHLCTNTDHSLLIDGYISHRSSFKVHLSSTYIQTLFRRTFRGLLCCHSFS
jgi:hypothetical protein